MESLRTARPASPQSASRRSRRWLPKLKPHQGFSMALVPRILDGLAANVVHCRISGFDSRAIMPTIGKATGAPLSIQRSFCDLSDAEAADIETISQLSGANWRGSFGWEELLRSQRILIVSEAGAGKTYECRTQQQLLWYAGDAAFFLELATLATSSVRDMLSAEEEKRLDEWLRSQSEIATFFLDSIDELNLTQGKFSQALKRLDKSVEGQLSRVRVVITTRPVPVDRVLIHQLLPIPSPSEAEPTAEEFADRVMDRRKKLEETPQIRAWRSVGLMPLSTAQMREFAILQNVSDPDALLIDIRLRDAEEFAQRPQDLIELCSDWREHQRIRTHR
jgi:hypothetical protein